MLNAFVPLRLIWIFALFGVCASVCDRLKPFLPIYVGIGILLLPVVATFAGEFLEESEDRDRHRAGLWTLLFASILYLTYVVAALVFMDPVYKPRDRFLFSVLDAVGFLPSGLLIVDSFLGLFRGRRVSLSWAPAVNQLAMILVAATFVVGGVGLAFVKGSDNAMSYACILFFGGCLSIGIHVWWTDYQLKKKVHVMTRGSTSFFRSSDVVLLFFGVAGAVIAFKGFFATSDKAYIISVGLLFFLYCVAFLVHRLRMWRGDVHSFIATREGLVDLHKLGWILYPWNDLSDIALMKGPGNMTIIGINFVRALADVQISGQAPEASREEFEKFVDGRTRKNDTNTMFYGYDLVIQPFFCRFGIVELWRNIQQLYVEQAPVDVEVHMDPAESPGTRSDDELRLQILLRLPSLKDFVGEYLPDGK